MKVNTLLIFAVLLCSACGNAPYESYGDAFSSAGAMELSEVVDGLSLNDSTAVKFEAEIENVCQMKGCWMTLKTTDGQSVRVTFKDYGFFVPKDAAGRRVIVDGVATLSNLDEATARHYAEDAGEEYDETSDRKEISVVASGVLIRTDS